MPDYALEGWVATAVLMFSLAVAWSLWRGPLRGETDLQPEPPEGRLRSDRREPGR